MNFPVKCVNNTFITRLIIRVLMETEPSGSGDSKAELATVEQALFFVSLRRSWGGVPREKPHAGRSTSPLLCLKCKYSGNVVIS